LTPFLATHCNVLYAPTSMRTYRKAQLLQEMLYNSGHEVRQILSSTVNFGNVGAKSLREISP
jgi:hypothetical protein